ncbi:MAG: hypothetical protein LBO80_02105 [Treponema sp.]|jgi:hypothetical protein|nr:hypothetical protein [Treponema sp.]
MGQKENRRLLIKLHNAITGSSKTCTEILNERTIDPDIALIHDTELSGKVVAGSTVSIKDYYPLRERRDDGRTPASVK